MDWASFKGFSFLEDINPIKVSSEEESGWLRWVIPLSKQISIKENIDIAASDVKVTLRKDAGDLEKNAASELARLLQKNPGNNAGNAKSWRVS